MVNANINIISNRTGSVVSAPSAGQQYLETSARLFYDFTKLTGIGDISNGNPGLLDRSGNGFTGTIVASPEAEIQTIGLYSVHSLKTVQGESSAIDTGSNGSTLFSSDFEVFAGITTNDGVTLTDQYYYGTTDDSFADIFRVRVDGGGVLIVRYTNNGANGQWASTNPVFINGVNAHAVFRVKMDFTNDVFGVWKNGTSVPGSFTAGSMAALNPSNFSSNRNFYVGLQNPPNVSSTTTLITRFAITPLLTSQQITDIESYFNYLPSI